MKKKKQAEFELKGKGMYNTQLDKEANKIKTARNKTFSEIKAILK